MEQTLFDIFGVLIFHMSSGRVKASALDRILPNHIESSSLFFERKFRALLMSNNDCSTIDRILLSEVIVLKLLS